MSHRGREVHTGDEISHRLGLRFADASLVERAMTHPSWSAENGGANYERLEFLGDSVLGFIVADLLHESYPDSSEGDLTRMKIELVRGGTLAELSRALGLDEFVRLGRGAERSGDRHRPSVLEGVFEALVGAVYLDGGVQAARVFVRGALGQRLEDVADPARSADAKTALQEITQARGAGLPSYRIVAEGGSSQAREFTAEVSLGDSVRGRGSGRSKQAAEQAAAADALTRLGPA